MSERQPLPTAPSASFRRKGALELAGERLRAAGASAGVRARLKGLYHAALMLGTLGRGLRSALPHGEVVRVLPAHRFMSWNPDEYEAFRSAVQPGMVALDVGANVGSYALLLGQWVGPRGKVFAFEPAPSVFAGLVGHVALNHLDGIVRPVAAAVGDRNGTARFSISPVAGESRLAGSAEESADTVPVTTIDAFCLKEDVQPGFIKIDVEGWELSALRGARQTIRRGGDRLALFVEMHPSIWPLLGVTKDDVLAELRAQSLVIAPLQPRTDVWAIEGACVRLVPGGQSVAPPAEAPCAS
jgi:FkbM family methyltransferase